MERTGILAVVDAGTTATTKPQALGSSSDENPETAHYIKLIANGDEAAERLMLAFWDFNHAYDDLVDQDKPVTLEHAAKVLATLTMELSFNPFWAKWSWMLMPLYLSCINRWVDGEEWLESEDPVRRRQSAVIRCGDVDFLLQFAYCTGGWDHLRACKAAREYDKED